MDQRSVLQPVHSAPGAPKREPRTAAHAQGELAGRGLLDAVLDMPVSEGTARASNALNEFLSEPAPWQALAFWLNRTVPPGTQLNRDQVARLLNRDVARLDDLLSRQVNAILHHPRFQQLEASWRGLRFLVEQVQEGENVKVRVLTLSWKELCRDVERALEFDQSQLFHKVYSEEFDTPGGEPFSVLLGDYEIRPRPNANHPTDDVAALDRVASVAAAAFAPFLTAAHPSLLDLTSFTDLERPTNLARTFEQVEYLKWRALRQSGASRFVALLLPRVLVRVPFEDDNSRVDGFRFHEDVGNPDRSGYLWGNAVYAFGSVAIRAYRDSGWLADIRGVPEDGRGGGQVEGLAVHSFATDKRGVATKSSTDAVISDQREKELGDLGFIPLCQCPDTNVSAFFGNQSIQQPRTYDRPEATANARLSAMLQYLLCVARFAHYIKVIARDRVGSFTGPADCEDFLHRWLARYTLSNDQADLETKAQYPLRESKVQVREVPTSPGSYQCVMHLRPHFQLDQLAMTVRLATELKPHSAA